MTATKKVLDIHTKTIIEVPADYIQCSCCGKWEAPSHYRNEGEKRQSRTNCTACYNLPWDDMLALGAMTKEIKKDHRLHRLAEELKAAQALREASMPVEDLIAALKKLPAGSRVCVTQDGYYADGQYGDLCDDFERVGDIDGNPVYSIGHSSQ